MPLYLSIVATVLVVIMLILLFIKKVPRWIPVLIGASVVAIVWISWIWINLE